MKNSDKHALLNLIRTAESTKCAAANLTHVTSFISKLTIKTYDPNDAQDGNYYSSYGASLEIGDPNEWSIPADGKMTLSNMTWVTNDINTTTAVVLRCSATSQTYSNDVFSEIGFTNSYQIGDIIKVTNISLTID